MAAAGIEGEIALVRVADANEAAGRRFLGPPSVRVDGEDVRATGQHDRAGGPRALEHAAAAGQRPERGGDPACRGRHETGCDGRSRDRSALLGHDGPHPRVDEALEAVGSGGQGVELQALAGGDEAEVADWLCRRGSGR